MTCHGLLKTVELPHVIFKLLARQSAPLTTSRVMRHIRIFPRAIGADRLGSVALHRIAWLAKLLAVISVSFLATGPAALDRFVAASPLSHSAAGSGPACSLPDRPHESGHLFGINLAGAEFAPEVPAAQFGKDYTYPTRDSLNYYRSHGFRLIRLPFLWERLQPEIYGELDPAELERLDRFIDLVLGRGMAIVIGPHNYARYRVRREAALIGSPLVPVSAFEDFWHRVATHFRARPAALAFSLMNEPHDTNGTWHRIAQAGLDAIRRAGSDHTVYVPGDGWSGAWQWRRYNSDLILNDPLNRLVYEAHQYFDQDGSGLYKTGYEQSGANPGLGVNRVKPFIAWLRRHRLRGAVTEYGVPNDDPRWLAVLDRFLAELSAAGLSGAYWAGGPWWGNYPLSSEPRDGKDAPVMSVLKKYTRRCSAP